MAECSMVLFGSHFPFSFRPCVFGDARPLCCLYGAMLAFRFFFFIRPFLFVYEFFFIFLWSFSTNSAAHSTSRGQSWYALRSGRCLPFARNNVVALRFLRIYNQKFTVAENCCGFQLITISHERCDHRFVTIPINRKHTKGVVV